MKKLPIFEYEKQEPDDVLKKDENGLLRTTVGQLNWAALQTRPDITFDAYSISIILNHAKYRHGKYSTKVLLKAKQEKVALTLSELGDMKDLHFELYADAALGNVEKDCQIGVGCFRD